MHRSDLILRSREPYALGGGYPEYVKRLQKDMWLAPEHIQDRVKQQQKVREQENLLLKSILKFKPGDKVMVYELPKSMKGISKKLLSPYHGPYTIEVQFNDVSYQHVHVSRIKRYIPRDIDIVPEHENREALPDGGQVIGDETDVHDTRYQRRQQTQHDDDKKKP